MPEHQALSHTFSVVLLVFKLYFHQSYYAALCKFFLSLSLCRSPDILSLSFVYLSHKCNIQLDSFATAHFHITPSIIIFIFSISSCSFDPKTVKCMIFHL